MEKEEEMVQSKKCSQVSTANNGGANGENGITVTQRKNTRKDTHWDFLDDIEAPKWADLTQECQAFYHDMDDEWFNTSHPFHHCSSQQLISAFTRSGEGSSNLDLSVPVEYSPKLPCSVSKSRGKDYRSREWGQRKERLTFDLQQSVKNLKNKTVSIVVSSDKTSYGRQLELTGSQMDSIGKSSLAEFEVQNDQSVPPLGDQESQMTRNQSPRCIAIQAHTSDQKQQFTKIFPNPTEVQEFAANSSFMRSINLPS